MKAVFLGTPEIAVKPLEYLCSKNDVEICAIVTQPDRPSGRGHKLTPPPIKVKAEELGINVFQTTSIRKDSDLIEKLKSLNADFFITVAFGQILSQEVIDIPKSGVINLHASLLPKYRGANPIQRAITNGEAKTGVTTMMTDIGLDTGDILLVEEIEITPDMTSPELAQKISSIGGDILYRTMTGLLDGSVKRQKQDDSLATKANKFQKQDGLIDFSADAQTIHNIVRGLRDWPCAYVEFKGAPLKIMKTSVADENKTSDKTGVILSIEKKGITISTTKGTILIEELQPQGKKVMKAYDWSHGVKLATGDFFK